MEKKKGKEYNFYYKGFSNSNFEGEYLNGERWNEKIYCLNDDNKYEIFELNNGKLNLQEYNKSGQLIYEGEYDENKRP